MLVATRDDQAGGDGLKLNAQEIRDQVLTLFLAGFETVANALAWTWMLLGQNPEAEARVHAELDAVLGGRLPTLEDIPRLEYLGQVLSESMRLYPPAWAMGGKRWRMFRSGRTGCVKGQWSSSASTSCIGTRNGFRSRSSFVQSDLRRKRRRAGRDSLIFRLVEVDGSASANRLRGWRPCWRWRRLRSVGGSNLFPGRRSNCSPRLRCGRRMGSGLKSFPQKPDAACSEMSTRVLNTRAIRIHRLAHSSQR